jgi:hypothetical protein
MLNEFEIAHFAKFIERFTFNPMSISIDLFFIGLATKFIMNKQSDKEIFEAYIIVNN